MNASSFDGSSYSKSMSKSVLWLNLMLMPNFTGSQELPMHEIVSSTLKNTLSARLQPVSFEIINLLLLLFNDDDVDVLAVGVFVLELELDCKKERKNKKIINIRIARNNYWTTHCGKLTRLVRFY